MSEDVIPWRTDAELEADDRAATEELARAEHHGLTRAKLRDLRALEEARAMLRAEKVAATNFDEQYLDRAGLLDLPTPDPLIERVLPRHAYAILRGRDHSFKSFVAIDWALCLATGKPWQDHQVEPARVLYVAGEGAHGLARRVEAWEYAWGRNVPADSFTVRTTALNMHQPGPAFDHLLEHVAVGGYGLVIVDTLRRVSGAADGNGSEMGLVVDNLDRIKRATNNGSVLAVAHTDKGDRDTRGYSGIEDDADVVWAAKREDMFLTLELTKFKDGRDGRKLVLEAQRHASSLILSGSTGPADVNTTESQTKILDAVRLVPDDKATITELMALSGLARTTFYRALKDLVDDEHLVLEKTSSGKRYRLPDDTLLAETPAEPDPDGDTDQLTLEGDAQ